MKRLDSFSTSFLHSGTQGPSFIMEQCANAHKKMCHDLENGLQCSLHNGDVSSYGSMITDTKYSIRFQVIVWSAGPVDVLSKRVKMKFRVSLFWNDDQEEISYSDADEEKKDDSISRADSSFLWQMNGRQRAYQSQTSNLYSKFIDVPRLSILNAVSFDIIGAPEILCLCEEKKLMRWSCLYKAELLQENMRVDR